MMLVNGGGGMDGLSQHLITQECVRARDAMMRMGRAVVVVAVAADGVHGAVSHAKSAMTPAHMQAFAQALRDEAAKLEAEARTPAARRGG